MHDVIHVGKVQNLLLGTNIVSKMMWGKEGKRSIGNDHDAVVVSRCDLLVVSSRPVIVDQEHIPPTKGLTWSGLLDLENSPGRLSPT